MDDERRDRFSHRGLAGRENVARQLRVQGCADVPTASSTATIGVPAGADLNRVWAEPNKRAHPTIWHAKAMIRKLTEERETVLFCDMHGHSRKKNVFAYGCQNTKARDAFDVRRKRPQPRRCPGKAPDKICPKILSENYPEAFSFPECSFRVQKSKESTARWWCGANSAWRIRSRWRRPSRVRAKARTANDAHPPSRT